MKALVLVAGSGNRFNRGLERRRHKCLAEVAGRRVADFSLDVAAELGVDGIVMVVGHLASSVMEVYGDDWNGIPIRYARQQEQLGLVHAMHCGREALERSPFCLFLGDEVLLGADPRPMRRAVEEGAAVVCGMIPTDDESLILKNYTLDFDPRTREIRRLIEKPELSLSPFIGTGCCLFDGDVLDYVDDMSVDPRTGRKELAGLVQAVIDDGRRVICHDFGPLPYVNLNTVDDYLRLQQAVIQSAAA